MAHPFTPVLTLLLAAGLLAGPVPAVAQSLGKPLPRFGDGADLSLAQERLIGEGVMMQLLRSPQLETDPFLHDHVVAMWARLREGAVRQGLLTPEQQRQFTWEVSLLRESELNAFALPGGYMGLHLGLIAASDNESELAAVLAHELSHVSQRHIARMIAKSERDMPLILGAMILGMLVAGQSSQGAQALIAGGQAAGMASQLGFSRDMEREADRMGLLVHTAAGYEAKGFVGMFRQLAQASRLYDTQSYPYLRSHPLTTEREADMMARIQQRSDSPEPVLSMQFALVKARAQVALAAPGDLERLILLYGQAKPAAPTAVQAGFLYAKTFALLRSGQAEAALVSWQALDRLVPLPDVARAWVTGLQAEIHLAMGRPEAALEAMGKGPFTRAQRLLRARAQLAMGTDAQRQAALEDLEILVALQPNDALVWDWIAQGWQAQGYPLRALRAQAEGLHARYDDRGALDRLRAAQEMGDRLRAQGRLKPADWQDLEIIQSRWRRISERQQALLRSRS